MELHPIAAHTFLQSEELCRAQQTQQSRRRYQHSPPSLVLAEAASSFDPSSLPLPRNASSTTSLSGWTMLATPSPTSGARKAHGLDTAALQAPRSPCMINGGGYAMTHRRNGFGSQSSNGTSVHPSSRHSSEFDAELLTPGDDRPRSMSVNIDAAKQDLLLEAYRVDPMPRYDVMERLAAQLTLTFDEVYRWFEDRSTRTTLVGQKSSIGYARGQYEQSRQRLPESPPAAPQVLASRSSAAVSHGPLLPARYPGRPGLPRADSRPMLGIRERHKVQRAGSPILSPKSFGRDISSQFYAADGAVSGGSRPTSSAGQNRSGPYRQSSGLLYGQNVPLSTGDVTGFQPMRGVDVRVHPSLQQQQQTQPATRDGYFPRASVHSVEFSDEPVAPPMIRDQRKYSAVRAQHAPPACYPVPVHVHGDSFLYVPGLTGSVCSSTPFSFASVHGGSMSYVSMNAAMPCKLPTNGHFLQPVQLHSAGTWTFHPTSAADPAGHSGGDGRQCCGSAVRTPGQSATAHCQARAAAHAGGLGQQQQHEQTQDLKDQQPPRRSVRRWFKRVFTRMSAPLRCGPADH